MDTILKTTALCKNFRGQMAVNNVSLHIQRNSIYELLGPNGAGTASVRKSDRIRKSKSTGNDAGSAGQTLSFRILQ